MLAVVVVVVVVVLVVIVVVVVVIVVVVVVVIIVVVVVVCELLLFAVVGCWLSAAVDVVVATASEMLATINIQLPQTLEKKTRL